MRSIPERVIIAIRDEKSGVLSEDALIVTVQDCGGGPWLHCLGRNLEPEEDMYGKGDSYAFALTSHEEIDELCRHLHEILNAVDTPPESINTSVNIIRDVI